MRLTKLPTFEGKTLGKKIKNNAFHPLWRVVVLVLDLDLDLGGDLGGRGGLDGHVEGVAEGGGERPQQQDVARVGLDLVGFSNVN